MLLPGRPAACDQVELEVGVARRQRRRRHGLRRQGRPPQVGVDHHPRGVDDREEGLTDTVGQAGLDGLQQGPGCGCGIGVSGEAGPGLGQDRADGARQGGGAVAGLKGAGDRVLTKRAHGRQAASGVRLRGVGGLYRQGAPLSLTDYREPARRRASEADDLGAGST